VKLIYGSSAEADLNRIFDYIAEDNPRAAERTLLRIEQTLLLLAEFPDIGHTGDVSETREFVIPNLKYRIVYRMEGNAIRVLNVNHTARQWP